MDTHAGEEPDFVKLIEKSRIRSKRWFVALVCVTILFFVTYVPTLIDRFQGYTSGVKSSALAEQQVKIWQRNMSCLGKPGTEVPARDKIMVTATVCETGDVLVRVRTPDNQQIYKWVPLDDVIGSYRERGGLIPSGPVG